MEINKFTEKVQIALKEVLGEDHDVIAQEIAKNNGVCLHGITIVSKGKNISPTIYLEPFHEAYEEGQPFSLIMDKITKVYERDTPKNNIDVSFFQNFDKVKDKICFRLINAELNQSLLDKIPHIRYLDLAISFYYAYSDEQLGDGAIQIYNNHAETWKTNAEELYALARFNTQKWFPACFTSTEILLRDLMGISEENMLPKDDLYNLLPMEVVSNEKRTLGSACMLYPGILEYIASRMDGNYYILPSSIHEIIILKDSPEVDRGQLKKMVVEVNDTLVAKEEILSYSVYYFDAKQYQLQKI